MQDVAKEIERVMLEDMQERDKIQPLRKPLSNPDTARGSLDEAIAVLRRVQDDAKVLASAIEAIERAAQKMAAEVGRARDAVEKAAGRL